jgi:putative restriction endonuclease
VAGHGRKPSSRDLVVWNDPRAVLPFIAVTDPAWFAFLRARAEREGGAVDEVNFWAPKSRDPIVRLPLGAPFFFRMKAPINAVAGYGFHVGHQLLSLEQAWQFFGTGNGDATFAEFLTRIGRYRRVDLVGDVRAPREPIGCTILRRAVFWPRERWLPWGEAQGWAKNIVQGKTERDPARAERLLDEIKFDELRIPEELDDSPFTPVEADERMLVLARDVRREGQGTFRSRLLDAYGRRCAITGEHTEIVLDAAHIQPYLGPRSNHVQNGLLLTQEFHTLFDRGYVTVTPDLRVRVSGRLAREWNNGKRYSAYDGQELRAVPDERERPARGALEWHAERVFVA